VATVSTPSPADRPARLDLATLSGLLGHALHRAGVSVTPERSGRFAALVDLAHPTTVTELRACARTTLAASRDEIAVLDRVLDMVFGGLGDVADDRGDPNQPHPSDDRSPAALPPEDSAGPERPEAVPSVASDVERLASTDFADLTPAELARLRALMAQLPIVLPRRTARRRRAHPHGDRLDVRATVRRAHRTGGDPVERVLEQRRQRPRRLVALLDISGSMAPYARAYVQLLHGARRATRAEVFTFATRLTRLTRTLEAANPSVALHRAARAAPDWSGGTRIAEAIKAFLDDHGRRGMARGAVVLIVSDGWERGDPAELAEQLARLRRLAHRIVWVNPRTAAPGYEPLVGGMAAAWPYCDTVVSGHHALALADVAAAIAV
jgi:uncharacterized protein with von Willebrand factor type A (vWA) domain